MKAAIKTRWVKALRSGKYKQGAGRLKNQENAFCCLGVLCDLHSRSKEGGGSWRGGHYTPKEKDRLGSSHLLPSVVSEWAEINDVGGSLKEPVMIKERQYRFLTALNDSGISFKRIASIIEKDLVK